MIKLCFAPLACTHSQGMYGERKTWSAQRLPSILVLSLYPQIEIDVFAATILSHRLCPGVTDSQLSKSEDCLGESFANKKETQILFLARALSGLMRCSHLSCVGSRSDDLDEATQSTPHVALLASRQSLSQRHFPIPTQKSTNC
jgi:hypothetical protein